MGQTKTEMNGNKIGQNMNVFLYERNDVMFSKNFSYGEIHGASISMHHVVSLKISTKRRKTSSGNKIKKIEIETEDGNTMDITLFMQKKVE